MHELQTAPAVCQLWMHVAGDSFAEWRRRPGLYLVGGCCDGQHPASAKAVRRVFKYDVHGDTWIPCAALLKPRDHLGLVGWRGRLHALGGWSGSRNRASCETYEPCENRWHTARHRLQTPRSGLAAAVSPDGTCFALAGWGGAQQGFLSSFECLQAEPPPPRSSGTPVSVAYSVYPHGAGSSSGAPVDESAADRDARGAADGRARPSAARSGCCGDGFRGAGAGSGGTDISVASLSHVSVPLTAVLHMARHCPAAAALGKHIYLTGGSGTAPDADAGVGAQPTASVERLDMEAIENGWEAGVAEMTQPRYRHAIATVGGKVYACGGQKIDVRPPRRSNTRPRCALTAVESVRARAGPRHRKCRAVRPNYGCVGGGGADASAAFLACRRGARWQALCGRWFRLRQVAQRGRAVRS